MDRAGELVAVGRVLRSWGRRGEVRLEPLTDDPGRFRELEACYLVPPETGERRRVESVWFQGATPVLKLAGVETPGEAAALVGRLVAIPRSAVRPLLPGHFYPFELEGCLVRTPEGAALGTLTGVVPGPGEGHDFWVLRAGARECLIPAVEAIVTEVDLGRQSVVIRPPEGLLDLD